jgi:hypothetical protein
MSVIHISSKAKDHMLLKITLSGTLPQHIAITHTFSTAVTNHDCLEAANVFAGSPS